MTTGERLAKAVAEIEALAPISPFAMTTDERRRLEAAMRLIDRLG